MLAQRIIIALAALAAGGPLNADPVEPTQEAKPPSARWVLSTTSPQVGEVFDAWLDVPAPANPSGTRKVTVLPASGVRVWRDEPSSAGLTWPLRANEPDLLALHVAASRAGTFHLVARIETVSGEPPANTSALVASDAFKVTEEPWFGEVGMAWISAGIGFVFGTLTSVLGLLWERRLKKQRLREECHLLIVKNVVPELVANRTLLDRFLANPRTPVTLQSGAYNTIQGDQGPFWVLTHHERRRYFSQLENLYRGFAQFNTLAGQEEKANEAVVLAKKLLTAITDQEAWKDAAESKAHRDKGD